MRDQDDALQAVHAAEKVELALGAVALPQPARIAGRPARHREPVVARQVQPLVKELVDLLSRAAVAAVDARRMNARPVERNRADEAVRALVVDARRPVPPDGKVTAFNAHVGQTP